MIEKEYIVENPLGLHARPAALFVQTTHKFDSRIRVIKDGQEVDGKSIMGILTLAAEKGSRLTIIFEGADESQAAAKMDEIFRRRFDEDQ
jgi:phosphocarrier protein HPr